MKDPGLAWYAMKRFGAGLLHWLVIIAAGAALSGAIWLIERYPRYCMVAVGGVLMIVMAWWWGGSYVRRRGVSGNYED